MQSSIDLLLPPLFPVTDDDHGAWVITVSTILLFITVLATTVTLISRIRVLRKISWSDCIVLFSCILFIPQSVCINIASSHGIGKHRNALNDTSFEIYSKALYASQLLAILVLGCSKAAVVLLVLSLQPFERITIACKVALCLIGTWSLTAFIALSTQCNQPRPWDFRPDRCINQEALYITLGGIHMILDLVSLLHQVQIIQWKRHQISALFAMRILVLALTIAGLRSVRPLFHSIPLDQPWNALMPAIWLQLILSSSIICTCIPTLKRVLVDLQTGMMAGTISVFLEQSVSGHNSQENSSPSKEKDSVGQKSGSGLASQYRVRRDSLDAELMGSYSTMRDTVIERDIYLGVRNGHP
ncbi:uncharacterized protein N7515_008208 [Penicillium bovifimosum]|uniref:Rhodopsin domain-containing protein n=1 Tax=Penicillium bovifimosum TaxID=126998 RepID=A0A9W9GMK1_9EURO|nr:uncharacterized protein N7515_008208 [Penicillium bovifimosum]KAJ5124383.1 hypothetical protein N7515_008208 [Penicillium bovifimosum]